MLLAAIDIGSNAVRLLFSNALERDGLFFADKATFVRIPVRLGEDVFRLGYIGKEKANNLIKTLTAFKLLLDVYQPIKYHACATAAMREAKNRDEIIAQIQEECGLNVKVIDGIEEARIIASVNNIELAKAFRYKMYIDVGGGSTEITVMKDSQLLKSESFLIGTIRLRENLIAIDEWQRMKEWLKPLRNEADKLFTVGSGGNINKIAKLYAKDNINILNYSDLQNAYEALSSVSLDYRILNLGMRPDRADVIVPAAEIFLKIMKWSRSEFIYIPKIGLPDGLINMMYKEIMTGVKLLG